MPLKNTHIQSLKLFFAKAALTMQTMERFLEKTEWDEMQLPGMASSLYPELSSEVSNTTERG